jgi:pilus assembly protein CpaD
MFRKLLPGRGDVTAIALRAVAMGGCVLVLAACTTAKQEVTASIPSDYRQRHPIVIKEGAQTLEVFVGNSRGGLAAAQRGDVHSFGRVWTREATGGIVIDLPTRTSNARAAADALREIRSLLTATGVPPQAIAVRPYQPADPAKLATIRLRYSKIVAEAGPCGLWPNDIGPSMNRDYIENRPHWNFGCASQRNLAAMVDNPADLVQPRGETPALASRRSTVLEKYRKGESTATAYPDASKGKISDIGQ